MSCEAVIGRCRAAGKKVYADVDSAMTKDYLIAAACDEIIMPPSGSLMLTGLAAEITFYKTLLDKLGVEAEIIQVGDFKGAAEPFTRTEMSAEFRQQFEVGHRRLLFSDGQHHRQGSPLGRGPGQIADRRRPVHARAGQRGQTRRSHLL